MKILAISGSPRRRGNTARLLERAVEGAAGRGAEVETIFVRDLKMSGCIACGGCDQEGLCVVEDDMQALYPKLRTYPRLIIASSVFFASIPAQLKAIIDRCQACWVEKYRLKKFVQERPQGRKALFISTCGWKKETRIGKEMFHCPLATIKAFLATLDIKLTETLLYHGIDDISPIDTRPEALQEAFEAGQRLAGT